MAFNSEPLWKSIVDTLEVLPYHILRHLDVFFCSFDNKLI